jgi:hypothetical protein
MTPSDEPFSAADLEVISRLRSAAAWAESLSWRLEAADVMDGDVMSGAALAPSAPGKTEDAAVNKKSRAPVRLRPRLVWAALVAVAIAAAVVVPQISRHTSSAGGKDTTSSTASPSDKGGGSPSRSSAAPCTTTVHGVAVESNGVVVELPVDPGSIISRADAISIARRNVSTTRHVVPPGGVAKLSSWKEIGSLIQASEQGGSEVESTPGPAAEPWSPVWAVLLTMPADKGPGAPGPAWYLVVMNATAGDLTLQTQTSVFPSWFSALSDRDPSLKGCPGGSSARLPFGVLTRDEEAYTVRSLQQPGTEVILTLTSVPALNRADPGLYGGCVRQNCSLDELVWPTFLVYRAAPGHTLACESSYGPPGISPKQVKEDFTLDVPDNDELGCGPVPPSLANLKDLAPPAS